MDVVLGAAVTGPVARLALVDGSSGEGRDLIDQSSVDLGADPARDLAEAVLGTQQLLVEDGHRLAATRVCWSDEVGMHELRRRLTAAGIFDVESVRQADAALAKVREVSQAAATGGRAGAALLFCDDDAVTLSIVGADEATATVWAAENIADSDTAAACTTLLTRLRSQCSTADTLCLMGTTTDLGDVARQIRGAAPIPLMIPDDTDLAFAHGATLAGFSADGYVSLSDSAGFAANEAVGSLDSGTTSVSPQIGPQLAYSMVDDSNSLPLLGNSRDAGAGQIPNQSKMSPLSWADDDDEDDDTVASGALPARPRFMLLSSAAAAAVIIAFAALAVTVAVGIRPDAQQVAVAPPKSHAMPRFSPLPTNPSAPLPSAPESLPNVEAKAVPLPGGGGPITAQLASAIGYPAAIPPGAPAPMAVPDLPQAPVGPQLPGWGMPGFAMPPVIFNVPNLVGQSATGWHWVTDGVGHRWWVPLSVQGTDIPTTINLAQPGGLPTSGQTGTGQTGVGQTATLAESKTGQPILTFNPHQDGVLTSSTDQQRTSTSVLGGDTRGLTPGSKTPMPATVGTNNGLPLPPDSNHSVILDPGGTKAAPGSTHGDPPPVGVVQRPNGIPLPDKPLAPPVADKPLAPAVKPAPLPVEVPKSVPAQLPTPAIQEPPKPVWTPPKPVWTPPVQEPPVQKWTPPVQQPAPVWTPPVQQPAPVWTPPKPVWTPPVQQAQPPVFTPPPVQQAPVFKLPPIFGGGGGGGLPPLFGGGGGGGFGGRHH